MSISARSSLDQRGPDSPTQFALKGLPGASGQRSQAACQTECVIGNDQKRAQGKSGVEEHQQERLVGCLKGTKGIYAQGVMLQAC